MSASELVVGFDLDLTLLDARRGIAATLEALSAETGVHVDTGVVIGRLGPPIETELAHWFPAETVPAATARYRQLYSSYAVPLSLPMPGASEAVDAVRREGGRVIVVTGKNALLARASLDRIGIEADAVEGQRFAEAKGEAIREHAVTIFVGDHAGDIAGARAGNAVAVGVATGPHDAAELAAAGADVVLPTLAAFPAWLADTVLDAKLDDLAANLAELGSVLVAFSGGADSAFLLAAAVRVLGSGNVVAATAVSPSLPAAELEAATAFTAALGVRHVTPATHEMARPGYRANGTDRCYFCKAELADVLGPLAGRHGLDHVVTGTNADDARDAFRPGIRAASERGARAPLRDAGFTKAQVRAVSRRWGLPTWDKPAAACLASRLAYGLAVTPARLARVERAEMALRAAFDEAGLAVRDVRVRDLGDVARIEVDAAIAATVAARPDLVAAVEGFDVVEVDPRGFRSGSMNERAPLATHQPG